jgi:hypothetical protein
VSARLQLELDRDRYTPGETITGRVLVLEGGDSQSLEVLLEYNETAEDDYSAVATSFSSGPLHTGDLATGMSFDFELALPPDALPNYRSRHGELYWQVDAKSAEVVGRDTHERRRIEVGNSSPR